MIEKKLKHRKNDLKNKKMKRIIRKPQKSKNHSLIDGLTTATGKSLPSIFTRYSASDFENV
jgi:hypothetical protein